MFVQDCNQVLLRSDLPEASVLCNDDTFAGFANIDFIVVIARAHPSRVVISKNCH